MDMSSRDKLTYAKTFDAVYLHGRLHLVANDVMLSDGCFTDAYFARSPLDVEPPVFLLKERYTAGPGVMCTQIVHPLGHPVRLDVHWKREVREGSTIVIRDSQGDHHVPIRIVKGKKPAGDRPDPLEVPVIAGVTVRQGIGYSNTYSLEEAVKNALEHMDPPAKKSTVADELSYFEISSMGVEIGGIAGFNRLRVVVRTYEPM